MSTAVAGMEKGGKAGVAASGLKAALDGLYAGFDFKGRALHDPIRFPMRYRTKADIEVAGFLAAAFAYGKVEHILAFLERLFSLLGGRPAEFVRDFRPERGGALFRGVRYRIWRTEDVVSLLQVAGTLLREYGSMEEAFIRGYSDDDHDIGKALAGFSGVAHAVDTSRIYGSRKKPTNFNFFPSPIRNSACKRTCLFLRWMVRDRDIDFGIWRRISKGKLVIPLDTHIARVSRCLGLTQRKTEDWKMAVEITAALKAMDPDDPLKYDFALCHRGIEGLCSSRGCTGCALKEHAA